MSRSDRSRSTDDTAALSLDVTIDGTSAEVSIRGEVDLGTVPLLDVVLTAVIEHGCTRVAVEASRVEFLDCAGLRPIAAAANLLRRDGGELVVRSPARPVVRVLELTGATAIVPIEEPASTVDEVSEAMPGGLTQMAAVPASTDMLEAVLDALVVLAAATISAADGASLTLRRHGQLATAASTGETFAALDQQQYDAGEGPCVDAAIEGRPFQVESAEDERRWPAFMGSVVDRGVHSILSTPLLTAMGPVGALNLYARRAGAFEAGGHDVATAFADQAATIVGYSGAQRSAEQVTERLRSALEARETIAQAQGILMGRQEVSAEQAYVILRRRSQDTDVPLIDQARQLIADVADPNGG